jgi:hypothetical protein
MSIKRIVEDKISKIEKAISKAPNAWYSETVSEAIKEAKHEIEHEVKVWYGEIGSFKTSGLMLWVTGAVCLFTGFGLGLLIG